MGSIRPLVAALLCLVVASSGCGRDTGDATSLPSDPTVLKQDYYGPIRVPAGAEVVSLTHTDPMEWQAVLEFSAVAAPAMTQHLVEDLASVEFHTGLPAGTLCTEGGFLPDGTGTCIVRAFVGGEGGRIRVSVSRPTLAAAGRIEITRQFTRRLVDDEIGPPYPGAAQAPLPPA